MRRIVCFVISLGLAGVAVAAHAQSEDDFGMYALRVCNNSIHEIAVAVMYQPFHGDLTGKDEWKEVSNGKEWLTRGWFTVNTGECTEKIEGMNANFYVHAHWSGRHSTYWGGDYSVCARYPGPFRKLVTANGSCPRGFEGESAEHIKVEKGTTLKYTLGG